MTSSASSASPRSRCWARTQDHGVRFYGLPTGYEFGSLVEAILDVSRGESLLADETRAGLAALDKDLRTAVFSTPT